MVKKVWTHKSCVKNTLVETDWSKKTRKKKLVELHKWREKTLLVQKRWWKSKRKD